MITSDKRVWERLKKNFLKQEQTKLQLGFFESDRYGPENDNLPMAQVAKWNEEGHINGGWFPDTETPPRPFLRVGLKHVLMAGGNDKEFRKVVTAVANGKSIFQPLRETGPAFRKTLQNTMEDWMSPPNSPATIDLKGFNDPLRETGELINHAGFKVVTGDE